MKNTRQSVNRRLLQTLTLLATMLPSGIPARSAEAVKPASADVPPTSPSSAETLQAAVPDSVVSKDQQFANQDLLGNWGGLRTSLWERGIKPTLLLITDPYGNTSGGLGRGFTTYSMLCADLKVDTAKAIGLKGGEFQAGFSLNFGSQLSQNVVGNTFPIQSSDVAPPGPRLTNLSYSQALFKDQLSLRAGRFSIDSLYGEEFAGSSYFRQFTSVAFNAIPFAIFYNAPGAFGYPATTWGARARYAPSGDYYLMAGIYNGDPEVGQANRHGLDFTLEGPPLGMAEIGWLRNQQPGATALPGNVKLGGFVLGGAVPAYNSTAQRSGRHGVYAVADQAVARLGSPEEGRQVGVFGSVVVAPDQAVSPMPMFFSTGLVANGPFASRPKDVLALGVAYGGYSAALRQQQQAQAILNPAILPQVSELTLELSYALQLLPGLILQPGIQYLIRPGGSPTTPNALALGVNTVISF